MNVPSNLAKSSVLALVIYWIIIASNEFDSDIIPFVLLSFIPIFLCVTIVVVGSICPFFWFTKNDTKVQVFNRYFPYYTCIALGASCYGIYASDYNIFHCAFFSSAYITTNQSWVWFAKEAIK